MEDVQVIAAWVATAGFVAMAAFQIILATGAPLGHLAWGGKYERLPGSLRAGSLVSAGIFVLGALCVLERAHVAEVLGRPRFASVVVWTMAGLTALSVLGNVVSPSKWEKRIMTPVALVLACACVIVALGP